MCLKAVQIEPNSELVMNFKTCDGTDDSLRTSMDVDMFHGDLLLPFAAIPLARLDLRSEATLGPSAPSALSTTPLGRSCRLRSPRR